ncbi:hypothetical protein BJV82DRAFT_673063 [Fennellomyces sp. T-0311]|nr:hypothetical protein BJV82DRAFT_673063 [Fennellomyces sp. T-0311]
MIDQVTEQLAKIQLKDEDVATYIAGIVEDESMEDEEKREVIAEFLSETTDENTDKVIESILLAWKERQGNAEKARAEEKAKALEEIHEREKARQERSVKEMQENAELRRNHAKQLTKEERAQRERLMQQYGYDLDGVRENAKGETEIVYKDRSGGAAAPIETPTSSKSKTRSVANK